MTAESQTHPEQHHTKMVGSMEMLKVIHVHAPRGHIPEGLKVATIDGPHSLKPLPSSPVLAVGAFTLWPMSYHDNRVSFGMVMYDPRWKVVHVVEKSGARYIHKITLEGHGHAGSVTFWGQTDQKVTLTLDELCHLLCHD